jgi:anti-sigma regulatory factor (Ser/Thr protein kinase)
MSAAIDPADKFRHEALLYRGWADFVAGTVRFIKEGLRAGEPILVVESAEKIGLLHNALDDDAGRVLFADMSEVGANPARIIPAWREFVTRHGGHGKRLRGIGEPIWYGRPADELVECQRHESLLNVAFDGRQPWRLLCPYDLGHLDESVIEEARRSHEYVIEDGEMQISREFRGVEACGAPLDTPLEAPKTGVQALRFDRDSLLGLRAEVTRYAIAAGLSAARASELVSAVNEVATNSILHGGGQGTLGMWRDSNNLVMEVRDAGMYDRPLADRERPGPHSSDPRGLWLVNHICDLVQIRTLVDGTIVRLRVKIDPKRHLHLVPTE